MEMTTDRRELGIRGQAIDHHGGGAHPAECPHHPKTALDASGQLAQVARFAGQLGLCIDLPEEQEHRARGGGHNAQRQQGLGEGEAQRAAHALGKAGEGGRTAGADRVRHAFSMRCTLDSASPCF